MFILANLFLAVAQILEFILWAFFWIMIARIAVSFIKVDTTIPVVRFLYGATDPVLDQVRRRWPVVYGGYDLSPIVIWIAIVFLQRFLVRTLYELAQWLR